MTVTHRWVVTPADHEWFTRFSGDANPIHSDPIAARRLLGGRMLCHGAHVLLRALDQSVASEAIVGVPARIAVVFRSGQAPGDEVSTVIADTDDEIDTDVTARRSIVVVDAHDESRVIATITVDTASEAIGPSDPPPQVGDLPTPARSLDLDAIDELAGRPQPEFAAVVDPAGCSARFPAVTRLFGAGRVAEIAAISGVVGMRSPGLRSMSSSYDIRWRRPAAASVTIGHTIDRFDRRLRRVHLTVTGPSMQASVVAFTPPDPVDQRLTLATGVRPDLDEFSPWRALVVGGSRGLGEATARLLAAGGADVRITWCVSDDDGERVTAELACAGARWCADQASLPAVVTHDWSPTHLCWFASPPWERDDATAVEVTAFERVASVLAARGLTGVLWPSSAVLDEASDAGTAWSERKLAGEAACARLGEAHPATTVHAARLPSLLTDRTQTLLPREYGDTASTLLAALRSLHPTPDRSPDHRASTTPGDGARWSDTVTRHD